MHHLLLQGGKWLSYHIDDLQPETDKIRDIHAIRDKPVSELLGTHAAASLADNLQNVTLDETTDAARDLDQPDDVMDTDDHTGVTQETEEMDYALSEDNYQPLADSAHSRQPDTPSRSMSGPPVQVPRPSPGRETGVNREKLVISCIHGAAAMLEDDVALNERKTDRVRMLCYLLEQIECNDGKLC